MAQTDKDFVGSIPEIYDSHLVPLIFESYALDLTQRVLNTSPQAVLEVAAGSGVVPRALAPKLPTSTRYVVTDLNQPMLDHAAANQPNPNTIEWLQADALDLPFDDASFDTLICQYGVMFYPDRVKGYEEARRVLRPDGAFIFNVWDSIEHNEFADTATKAAGEIFPGDPPMFLARTPHGYNDPSQITAELEAAGFQNISYDVITEASRADHASVPAIAYCQGTPLRIEIEERDATKLSEVTEHATNLISSKFGETNIAGKIQAIVFTAHA